MYRIYDLAGRVARLRQFVCDSACMASVTRRRNRSKEMGSESEVPPTSAVVPHPLPKSQSCLKTEEDRLSAKSRRACQSDAG
uniref:HTH merR-type domain-containing protein n=1 Tax=Panagrellus redivivus TaxID=6233 RepID=A0A7E4ZTG8_PANRE